MAGNETEQLNGMTAMEQQPSAAVFYTQEPTPDEELSYLSVGGSDAGTDGAQSSPAAEGAQEGEEDVITARTAADVAFMTVAELQSATGGAATSDAAIADALPLQVVEDRALVAAVAANVAAKADQPAAGNEEAAATGVNLDAGNGQASAATPTAAEQQQQAIEASVPAAVSPISAVAAAKPVPARLLYGYKEESAPAAAAEAKLSLPQQQDRDKLEREKRRMYHPAADTPLTLPAYAVDDGGWETGVAARPPGYDPVDLFIGGLPPAADEVGVWSAVVPAGEVVSIKLIRRKRDRGECRGYGFVKMVNRQAADAACEQVKQACGMPVALSMPGGRSVAELHAAAAAAVAAAPLESLVDADTSISKLLRALREQQDRQGAVLVALAATLHLPDRPRLAYMPGSEPSLAAIEAATAAATQQAEAGPEAAAAAPEVKDGQPVSSTDRSSEPLEDYLATYPRIQSLLAKSNGRKADKAQPDKTPLSLVYEYAARLSLEVVVKEVDAGAAGTGPFTLEAQLVARHGGQCFAEGTGRGRSKQLARQAAAAALLDALLATVPEQDLLASNKARQEREAAAATAAATAARALESHGGRGGGRGGRSPYGRGPGGRGPGGHASGLHSYGPDRSRGPRDHLGWSQEQRGGSRGPYPSREGPPRYREQQPHFNGSGISGSLRAGPPAQSLSMGRMAPVAAGYQQQQYGQPMAQAMEPQVILAAPVAMAMPQMQAGNTGGYSMGGAQVAAGYAADTVQPFMQQQQLGMNNGAYQPGLAMQRTAPASATAYGMLQHGTGGPYTTATAAGVGEPPYSVTISAPSQPGYSATVPMSMSNGSFGTQPAAAAVTQYAPQRQQQQQHVQAYAMQEQQQEQQHMQAHAMQQQQQQQQQQLASHVAQAQQAYAMQQQQAASGYGQQGAMAGGYGTQPPPQTLSPPAPAARKYISNTSGGGSGGTSDAAAAASVGQRAHMPAAYVQGASAASTAEGYSGYAVQQQQASQAVQVVQPYSIAYNAACTAQQLAQAAPTHGYGRVARAPQGQPQAAAAQEAARAEAHPQQAYNPTAPSRYWP